MIEALKAESAMLSQIRDRLNVHHLALPKDDPVRMGLSAALGDVTRAIGAVETCIEELGSRNPTPRDPRQREG